MRSEGTYDTIGGAPQSPRDPDYLPTKLVEEVLGLLEEAGVPTVINDRIVDLIEAWEQAEPAAVPGAAGPRY